MSSKDNAAVNQLFERLECRYAMRVLWALRDGHPQTFRLLQDSVGGITPNTLNTRIKELREASLLDHGSEGYTVTPLGQDLLKRLSDVQPFALRWAATHPRKVTVRATPAAAPVSPSSVAPDAQGAPPAHTTPATPRPSDD
ncbi:helix-turn-helix transcriptional regulator [Diaphorobacter aerolatus]|uniref:Helix-turn-helix transcriptional regulator n=1 Tax=Diaphorobacter aerolatus TaxID=1288495 RepID=A0A7H0GMI7_9BURK|nr:helix-turn-helix transcriptional regulator [Diaphorobacter aerolatus]